jgi:scyllo-inosamine-4-phosphate amidinotransferase 1
MKISSNNEWGKLRSVVVGKADHANWPTNDPVFSKESKKTLWKETPVPSGKVPQWIIDEANEDLNILVSTLLHLGVEVYRPTKMNFQKLEGMYNYCPRDRLLVAGDIIVDPAMMYPCRDQEIDALKFVVESAEEVLVMPKNKRMVLDAANVCRLGNDWLYLKSPSGNKSAYNWLQSQFSNINIELCDFYGGVHIDSTIVPLREGLVLLNGSRVNELNCPKVFDNWEKIYFTDIVEQGFYQYPYASKWIGLNLLVVDNNTIIADVNQHTLIKLLESYQFNVIPLELRHSRTLGGGFHCVTLDLVRD